MRSSGAWTVPSTRSRANRPFDGLRATPRPNRTAFSLLPVPHKDLAGVASSAVRRRRPGARSSSTLLNDRKANQQQQLARRIRSRVSAPALTRRVGHLSNPAAPSRRAQTSLPCGTMWTALETRGIASAGSSAQLRAVVRRAAVFAVRRCAALRSVTRAGEAVDDLSMCLSESLSDSDGHIVR